MKHNINLILLMVFFTVFSNRVNAEFLDDGDLDGADLAAMVQAYGSVQGNLRYLPEADFGSDGDVDLEDFLFFASKFGRMDLELPHFMAEIGPSGGNLRIEHVESALHGVELSIQPGALGTNSIISISGNRSFIEETATPEIHINLEPHGLAFSNPVKLRIPLYDYYTIDNTKTPVAYALGNHSSEIIETTRVLDNHIELELNQSSDIILTTRDKAYLVFDIRPPKVLVKGSKFLRKGDILFTMVEDNEKANYDPNGHVGMYTGPVHETKLPDGMNNCLHDDEYTIVEATPYSCNNLCSDECMGVRSACLDSNFIKEEDSQHLYLGSRRPNNLKGNPDSENIQKRASTNAINKLGKGYCNYVGFDNKYVCFELIFKSYDEADSPIVPIWKIPNLSTLLNNTYPVRIITAAVYQDVKIPIYVVAEKEGEDNDYEKIANGPDNEHIEMSNAPSGATWANSLFEWIPNCNDVGTEKAIGFTYQGRDGQNAIGKILKIKVVDSDIDEDGLNSCEGDDDSDGDGFSDDEDAFPGDPNEWLDTDNDGEGNNSDIDDDNDGYDDPLDLFPFDPNEWDDNDHDGKGDNSDQCPDTPQDENVDENGCSSSQIDSDGDGHYANEDCDDSDSTVHPGATEIRDNGKNDDCNPDTPDSSLDIDDDDDGFSENEGDCDDDNLLRHPEAAEICSDQLDNDCDGSEDCNDPDCHGSEACLNACIDADGDGFYSKNDCGTSVDCCDDDSTIHPGAVEICDDNKDNNCNGIIDECVWARHESSPNQSSDILSIDIADDGKIWAAGSGPCILNSSDGGENWNRFCPDIGSAFMGIDFIDAEVGWIIGTGGYILKTENGGASWTLQNFDMTPDHNNHLTSVFAVSWTEAWINGYIVNTGSSEPSGYIRFHTTNGGTTWNKHTHLSQGATLNASFFLNEDEGWMVGDNGIIIHTNNGGSSWELMDFFTDRPTCPFHIQSVQFLSETEGWIVGHEKCLGFWPKIYKTVDGGQTWTLKFEAHNWGGYFKKILFTSTDNGLCFGHFSCPDPPFTGGVCSILKTTDGGENWSRAYECVGDVWLNSADIRNGKGWAVGEDGIVLQYPGTCYF